CSPRVRRPLRSPRAVAPPTSARGGRWSPCVLTTCTAASGSPSRSRTILLPLRRRATDPDLDICPPGLRALHRQHVDEVDVRILCQERRPGLGERGRDLAGEMRLTRRLVLEGVEDPERVPVHAEAVPDARARLPFHDPLPRLDERLDVGLLAGLRLHE